MSQESRELTAEELDAQSVSELPEREAMSLVDLNAAAPVNLAAALNVGAEDSTAIADADQTADISQSNA